MDRDSLVAPDSSFWQTQNFSSSRNQSFRPSSELQQILNESYVIFLENCPITGFLVVKNSQDVRSSGEITNTELQIIK